MFFHNQHGSTESHFFHNRCLFPMLRTPRGSRPGATKAILVFVWLPSCNGNLPPSSPVRLSSRRSPQSGGNRSHSPISGRAGVGKFHLTTVRLPKYAVLTPFKKACDTNTNYNLYGHAPCKCFRILICLKQGEENRCSGNQHRGGYNRGP